MISVVCLMSLSVLWPLTHGDAEVSCVFMESCILPCSFQAGNDPVIHWTYVTAGVTSVQSYYQNQDQLAGQDQRFRGRTSLSKDQISRGNASLRLTGVEVQDQGRYKCFTSILRGNKDSFINLKVDAPVRNIDIQQVGNSITCSSEGIYPEPELTWTTSPPTNFKNTTRVQKTEQQIYNIISSLMVSDGVSDLVYSCSIKTRSNRRKATWRQLSSIVGSSTDTTVPCTTSNTSIVGFSLVWRFNHSQIILNQTEANVGQSVSEEWRQQVKGVSESGSIRLQNLSSKQEGIYTCELSNPEETHTSNTIVRTEKGSQTGVLVIIVAVLVGLVLVALLTGLILYFIYKKAQTRPSNQPVFCLQERCA